MLARTEKTGTQAARKKSAARLKALIKAGDDAKTQTSEINGAFGSRVNEAVDKHGLDKTAFRIVRQLNRLSPEKLNSTLPNLLAYIDDLELEDKAASAPGLGIEGEGEEASEEE
jgi:hypothetical protein